MPDKIENKDIEFQPPVKGYSYSSSDPVAKPQPPTNPNPQNPSAKKNSGKSLNTIFTLVFSVLGFLFLFFIFLMVLNYFNVISLSTISPVFKTLPKSPTVIQTADQEDKPNNIPGTNQYEIEGILEKYDQNTVGIKFAKKIITLEYNFDSKFYFTRTFMNTESATPAAETIAIIDFPSNILSKENIGKIVSVQYRNEKNKNILESLTLDK